MNEQQWLIKAEFEYYLAKIGVTKYKLEEQIEVKSDKFIGWILQLGHQINAQGRGIFIGIDKEPNQIKKSINKYYQEIFGTKLKDIVDD